MPAAEPDRAAPVASRRASRTRATLDWLGVIGASVLISLVVRAFVVQSFFIPTPSMEPTLVGDRRGDGTVGTGDRILVNKLSYRLHGVNRGDVVVFRIPDTTAPVVDTIDGSGQPTSDLVKRVIGLPGETIVFADGRVHVNGTPLDEPYLAPATQSRPGPGNETWTHTCTTEDPCVVPEGAVWVMGDNRAVSKDSRWLGPIRQDAIVGRAFVIVWPAGRAGGL